MLTCQVPATFASLPCALDARAAAAMNRAAAASAIIFRFIGFLQAARRSLRAAVVFVSLPRRTRYLAGAGEILGRSFPAQTSPRDLAAVFHLIQYVRHIRLQLESLVKFGTRLFTFSLHRQHGG